MNDPKSLRLTLYRGVIATTGLLKSSDDRWQLAKKPPEPERQ